MATNLMGFAGAQPILRATCSISDLGDKHADIHAIRWIWLFDIAKPVRASQYPIGYALGVWGLPIGPTPLLSEEARAVLKSGVKVHRDQYPIVAARRQAYETLRWQTPILAVVTQGFVLATAFGESVALLLALVLCAISVLIGIAAIQLFVRIRFLELEDSKTLRSYEQSRVDDGFSVVHVRRDAPKGFARYSAYPIWLAVLGGTIVLSGAAFIQFAIRLYSY
jgi:hypothetical protein